MILLGLGLAIAITAATALADEWRRSGLQRERLAGTSLRFEVVALAAVFIGVGVAIGYVGIAP